MTSLEEYTLTV